jgi:hypothetical protein
MAKLNSEFSFTGSLGEISAYRMRGVDGIVLRKKGGPTKKQIATSPRFETMRRGNAEFGGRSTMSKAILDALHPLKSLADINSMSALNAHLKPIQERDVLSEYGKRCIELSKHHRLLLGFSFNKKNPIESFLLTPIHSSFDEENGTVTMHIPEIIPGITFRNFGQYPYYRFILAIGEVTDLIWTSNGYKPSGVELRNYSSYACSDWKPSRAATSATDLSLSLPHKAKNGQMTYVAGVGICFGQVSEKGVIASRFGAARVAGVSTY